MWPVGFVRFLNGVVVGMCCGLGSNRGYRLWHGDTTQGSRRRIRTERPDVLLTTPESLEAMLVSTRLTPR